MKNLIKFGAKQYGGLVLKQWDNSVKHPDRFQNEIFDRLVLMGKDTAFGKDHNLEDVITYKDFCEAVPLRDYESFLPYIERIKAGEKDILFPGSPSYFAKSSGTTSSVKYIPVQKEFMKTYSKSGLSLLFSFMRETNNYDILLGKIMMLQGSPEMEAENGIKIGRMSGISYHVMPAVLRKSRLPSYAANTIEDWEEKINAIVKETSTADLRALGGIPPWVLMYFDYLTEYTKEKLVKNVFPNLQLYVHGGVNMEPYRNIIFEKIGKQIPTLDTYTASEGFLGFQESIHNKAMTICSNNGIFFEFVPLEEYRKNPKNPKRYKLTEVKKDINYVVVLNTMSGLWGYVIGDTIRFTSTFPFQFLITGRVTQYTSLFGEHIIASEVRQALEVAMTKFGFNVRAFTVAPNLLPESTQSHHEWWIEFDRLPGNLEEIAALIDKEMQKQNCYYADIIEGKVIAPLKIIPVGPKGFERCFLKEKKIDGQNKIPVLANSRDLVDQLDAYKLVVPNE